VPATLRPAQSALLTFDENASEPPVVVP